MSAWGVTNFENDIALDFVGTLVHEHVEFSISTYSDDFRSKFSPEETSLDDCLIYFAVAELLAALLGEPSEDIPLELKAWIEAKYIKIEQPLVDSVIEVIKLLLKDSEAKEMYSDTPYYKAWQETQKGLIKRLKA